MFPGEFLQARFQPLASPFVAFGHHFTFDIRQKWQGLGVCFGRFHKMTRLAWLMFRRVEEPLLAKFSQIQGQCQDAPLKSPFLILIVILIVIPGRIKIMTMIKIKL